MCRSIAEGYRRCPGCNDPLRRTLINVRQRIGRYERAAKRAGKAQQWDRVEHYVDLLDRDCAQHDQLTRLDPPPPPPSRAGEFTAEATASWSEDALVAAVSDVQGDPEALDALMSRLDERETEKQRAAEAERERADAEAAQQRQAEAHSTPLTDPTRRSSRRLTAEQRCREAYDHHVLEQYMQAEDECRGHLLNKKGQAKGVNPAMLFEGPAHVARAYASKELLQWWGRNGRTTYRQWRYSWLQRPSDRKAAATAQRQSLGDAPA
ncbi:hypothetical protein [Actinopolyspora alba]|nr:hypothetical protein [Actinopolyspora alba]